MSSATPEPTPPQPERAESPGWPIILLGLLAVLVVIGALLPIGKAFQMNDPHFMTWVRVLGVLVTLAIFSVLYKENPIFRFAEHIFIGLATGYGVVVTWFEVVVPRWLHPMLPASLAHPVLQDGQMVDPGGQGQWWLFFALLIGLLFFTVYLPKLAWMNRFALSILMGWAAGNAFQQFMGLIAPQIVAAFKPPATHYAPKSVPLGDLNNLQTGSWFWHPWWLISLVVMVCVLAYFFFSIEHRHNIVRRPAVAGRYLLMITLGAIFGTTVMGRFSLAIERLDFLLAATRDWGATSAHWLHHLIR